MSLRLNLDGRNRVNLTKILPEGEIHGVKAYREGNKIILEPLAELPAHEVWLHQNPETMRVVQKGLKQKGKHKLGPFSKYLEDDDEV